jgi:uncharacterized protein YlxP (DUF503 family)
MPVSTRQKSRREIQDQIIPGELELQSFRDEVNIAVIRGLRSAIKDVSYKAKIQISKKLLDHLKRKYNLNFAFKESIDLLDDFRIIRANFTNPRNYCKATNFKVALRRSRDIEYKSFSDGQLVTNILSPLPFFVISFVRDDLVLSAKLKR